MSHWLKVFLSSLLDSSPAPAILPMHTVHRRLPEINRCSHKVLLANYYSTTFFLMLRVVVVVISQLACLVVFF